MNEQGSLEWRRERLGRVTASRFADVLAGPASAVYLSYARQLRTELALLERIKAGEEIPLDPDFYSAATAWGKKHEPAARAEYEWRHEVDVTVPPLIVHPVYQFVACSLDGRYMRVGLEIKCPFNQTVHSTTLLHGMPGDHAPQVQGGIWVAELSAVDFISFDPRRTDAGRYFEKRTERDDRYIARLEKAVLEFWQFVISGEEIKKAEPGSVPILF